MANTTQAKKEEPKSVFDVLYSVDVNDKKEEKNGLSYLSWTWAWAEVKKRFPDANYEMVKFDGIPYVFDPKTGYMVFTKVTIDGITHEMWLPVMDANNLAMKDQPYDVQTKYKKITVKAATMFDINKTMMRCLVKNLAMFGLGLYIYAGDDLPEDTTPSDDAEALKTANKSQIEASKSKQVLCTECNKPITDCGKYTAGAIIEESTKKNGRPICLKCWQALADAKRKAQGVK